MIYAPKVVHSTRSLCIGLPRAWRILIWCGVYCHWLKNVLLRWKVRWRRSVLQSCETYYMCQRCNSKLCQIHLRCWAAAKQRVTINDKSYASQDADAKLNVIADIKIINVLQTELSDPSNNVIFTNWVESKYRHLLVKHGPFVEDLHKSYKNYLRNLTEEKLKNVAFQKLSRANEPKHLCSNHLWSIQSDTMDFAIKV